MMPVHFYSTKKMNRRYFPDGETTDVADKHPDVVKRLQEFASKMDADLGPTKPGPGVRPPGKVEMARPLLLK